MKLTHHGWMMAVIAAAAAAPPARADDTHISYLIAAEMRNAQSALQAGQWQLALNILATAEAKSPLSPFEYKTIYDFEGYAHIKLGDQRSAQQNFESELATCAANAQETDATVHRLLALAGLNKDFAKAEQYGQYLLDYGSVSPFELTQLAAAYYQQSDCSSVAALADRGYAAAQQSGTLVPPLLTQLKMACRGATPILNRAPYPTLCQNGPSNSGGAAAAQTAATAESQPSRSSSDAGASTTALDASLDSCVKLMGDGKSTWFDNGCNTPVVIKEFQKGYSGGDLYCNQGGRCSVGTAGKDYSLTADWLFAVCPKGDFVESADGNPWRGSGPYQCRKP